MISREKFCASHENQIHATSAFRDSSDEQDIKPILELSYEHRKEGGIEALNQLIMFLEDPSMNGMTPLERAKRIKESIEKL